MLKRVFLGWLRRRIRPLWNGGGPHDRGRGRQAAEAVNGKTWSANARASSIACKSALIRLGIRGIKPTAAQGAAASGVAAHTRKRFADPTEHARRDRARPPTRLALLREQIKAIEQARLARLEQAPQTGPNVMVRLLASILGVGVETADMLVQEEYFIAQSA